MTVNELIAMWEPYKGTYGKHAIATRIHRAFSWLKRADQVIDDSDLDIVMLSLWISFNSLYGRWDGSRHEPESDRQGWRAFLDRMLEIDSAQAISKTLIEHKNLVREILDDSFLQNHYWKDPTLEKARKTTRSKQEALTWYIEERWSLILDEVMQDIYLLRCQLVHGAATYNSKLNRPALRHCTDMLQHILLATVSVLIQDGRDEDWGEMCYPPIRA